MKKNVFILVLFLMIMGCGQTKNKWIKAKQTNSIVEVEKFLKENSGSEFENEAINFKDSLELAKIEQENSIVELKNFIKENPNSVLFKKAKNLFDSLEWINSKNINTIEGYNLFLNNNPSSKRDAEARMNIEILQTGSFKDLRDGKVYKIVKIATQIWLAQNLAFKAKSGCWACDNDEKYVGTYGYLYDWETAQTACPSGWHLSTVTEWETLIAFMGGESVAGGKLKEKGTKHWPNNTGSLNTVGFSALPGGVRNSDGSFGMLDGIGSWWSISNDPSSKAWNWTIIDNSISKSNFNSVQNGFSVRCVKD